MRVLCRGIILAIVALAPPSLAAQTFSGHVRAEDGSAVTGAMVTFSHGEPLHRVTVFTGDGGAFRSPDLGGFDCTCPLRTSAARAVTQEPAAARGQP